jgi:hypothetical protein
MFIAHLPLGYLASKSLLRWPAIQMLDKPSRRSIILAGCIGALAPDLDVIYHFATSKTGHHHVWAPHWPLTWFAIALLLFCIPSIRTHSTRKAMAVAFSLNGLLHVAIDSITAPVLWAKPFADWKIELAHVTQCAEVENACRLWTGWMEIGAVFQKAGLHFLPNGWACSEKNYIRDMICNWTFGIELFVLLAALVLLVRSSRRRNPT